MNEKILIGMFVVLISASAVQADPGQQVVIETEVSFSPLAEGTFTASAPLCASGTFVTTQFITNPSLFHGHGFMSEAEYTCDDDSGTFKIQLHPLSQGWHSTEFLLTGPWQVVNGGTGDYARMSGRGDFGAVVNFDVEPWTGEETFVGFVKLK